MRNILSLILAALLLALSSACGRQEGTVGTADNPLVVLLGPSYAERANPKDLEALGAFLQQETGLTIEVRGAKTAVEAIESFSGKSDVGLLNLFEYLLAQKEYKVEAGLQLVRNGSFSYAGEIVVKKDSGISGIKDLSGKKIAYVDQYSSSGFVFPSQLLAKEKVTPAAEFTGSPERSLEKLKAGQVDAAAVFTGAAASDPTLVIIATTPMIPNEPIVFRARLVAQKKEALITALQKFAATPNGTRILSSIAGITGLRPITDNDYKEVDTLLQSSGQSVADLVQNGWRVNQPAADLVP